MNGIKFLNDGHVVIEDARVINNFSNFSGEESQFNRKGDRNFVISIEDPAAAQTLKDSGWNIKIYVPRNDPDADPVYQLKCKIGYKYSVKPIIKMVQNGRITRLDEETIDILDAMYIERVDLLLNPAHWSNISGSGVTAWVTEMKAYIQSEYFDDDLAESEFPE